MNDEFSKDEGASLWRQAMAAAQPHSVVKTISPLDLASWLDGRADERLSARIEAAMSADPVLLETALAAAAATSELDSPVSERIAVRARALVSPPIKVAARRGGWLSGGAGWRRQAEWAMVGLSLMVAAAAGLWIGGGVGDSLLSETATVSLFDDDTGFGGLLSSTEDL
jgi:hypothetical protein